MSPRVEVPIQNFKIPFRNDVSGFKAGSPVLERFWDG